MHLEQSEGFLQVTGLAVHTHIGVHAWEQRIKQKLLIDICIPLDCRQCEDNLEKTLDYFALCESVTTFVESQSFQLIETVVTQLSTHILTRFKVPEVRLTVSKPQAIPQAANIQISSTLKFSNTANEHSGT
jgi:dihydroneopterin aldolase